ncbi:hypothetical protein [Rhizobium mayense]|uniref:SMODS and SLOG-associating 2TM effector domain-containing protein n=1 Tax=Rhizobium mayense TaxID=1312184 RepID=A0ABT7JS03_9HYPH|nr:hypothetical protein [Rhizobium mayense]MDL2399127.1 hypothetical protein [Rhizobium mayense]
MDRDQIRFNVLRNALYHTSRRLTFDRWNRWFNFAVILLGATAMSNLLQRFGIDVSQGAVGAAVAAVGAAQLVFDFGGKSRDHQSLQRDYYHLLADIEEKIDPTQAELALWFGKMTRIAGDEPPTLRALDAKAYNDAIGATEYYSPDQRIHIPWHHRFLGLVWAFEGYDYKKLCEIRGANKQSL